MKAGPAPAGYVDPCPVEALHEAVITQRIPVTIQSCVAEPSPQLNHWMDPVFDATYSHVTGWISRAGSAPAGYVDPCGPTPSSANEVVVAPLVLPNVNGGEVSYILLL